MERFHLLLARANENPLSVRHPDRRTAKKPIDHAYPIREKHSEAKT